MLVKVLKLQGGEQLISGIAEISRMKLGKVLDFLQDY
jgi:hypothetical protein